MGDEKDPAEAWTPDRRWTAMLAALESGETLEMEKYILIARKKRAVEH